MKVKTKFARLIKFWKPAQKGICILFLLLAIPNAVLGQEIADEMLSPDGKSRLVLCGNGGRLFYEVFRNGALLIGKSEIGMTFGRHTTLGFNDLRAEHSSFSGSLEVPFGEEISRPDEYSLLTLHISADIEVVSEIRLYNEGLAIRFKYSGDAEIEATGDLTEFNLSHHSLTGQLLRRNEDPYEEISPQQGSYTSIPPYTCYGSGAAFCFHEAANRAVSSRAKVLINRGVVSFSVSSAKSSSLVLPWRYVVWGSSAEDLMKGKYIVYSLNEPFSGDISWIKPGKVFRCEEMETAKVKEAVDFAFGMDFQHVLLDAGWYGLGKAKENSPLSNPFEPLETLDISEIVSYARERGIGIILYVNKAAWQNYDWKRMIDTYAAWGISGIKMGFMDGESIGGLELIYQAIEYGMEKRIFFNVHDNVYPTGWQRRLPNLLTTEGIRGNEHEDNSCEHNTMLPFTRYMAGPADYTFCVQSRNITEEMHWKIVANKQTRVNQMAMATIFQSPLQHLFWYGRPGWYKDIPPEETDYYRLLPTTWDQSLMLGGEPGKYAAMARRKGGKWFLAISNNSEARTVKLDLGWLEGGAYDITAYTDDIRGGGQFVCREYSAALPPSLEISLPPNGGAVCILETGPGDDGGDGPSTPVLTPLDAAADGGRLMESQDLAQEMDNSSVYPNPAQQFVHVRSQIQNLNYSLHSADGKMVAEGAGDEINVEGLPQGVYILRIYRQGASKSFRVTKI